MLLWVLNIFYVLIAIAMTVLILMQRGAGAQAGAGFGGGASGTVFGSQGSSNFLSKSTKWLAVAFFGLTLGMAWMHMQGSRAAKPQTDLGVMAGHQPAPTIPSAVPAAPAIPSAPATPAIPQATPPAQPAPAVPAPSNVPAAPSRPAQGG